jgi:hypothetical protein
MVIAEVLMVLIVVIMSATIYIWVVPAFQSQTTTDTSHYSYEEHFQTITGSFASFVQSTPESVAPSPGPITPYTICNGSIATATTANIFVPVNGVCKITANVGNIYVSQGGNLTVTGVTINHDLYSDGGLAVSLTNVNVVGWIYTANVTSISIIRSSLNTSGNTNNGGCIDGCNSALWDGGRGLFTMINDTVNGQIESEVSHYAIVTGNTISGRLEVECADFGQIQNNIIGGTLDLDQNGVVAISGNTVNGNALYGSNGWCGTAFNQIRGTISGSCIGNLTVDVLNTGAIPVTLVTLYMSNVPFNGNLTWSLASGHQVQCGNTLSTTCTTLPIIIPVGEMARITMGWVPPAANSYALPWNYVYFTFVSRYSNFVDGYLYFTLGLGLQQESRLINRVCPPCS